MEKPIKKIFTYGKDEVTITCHACGRIKTLKASLVNQIHHPVRIKCACGISSNVLFEKRVHYRKMTHLEGRYSIKVDPDAWLCLLVVENLSRNGIGFKTVGKYDIKEGDILSIQFSLDNPKASTIKGKIVVKSVNDNYIGAEFFALDEHAKKELGFYLMP
ncbi:MAG: PilZ domain-containing protein [Deltaproteobacteria bacterium]|nr:PilZ domain-containing protein [Deltaproteobacteria bacterium]